MAKLCRIQTPRGMSATHVDFPKDCERSREGSLYVRPNTVLEVTEAEADYLAASQSWGKRLQRLPDLLAPDSKVSAPSKATTKAEEDKSAKKPESKGKDKSTPKSKLANK